MPDTVTRLRGFAGSIGAVIEDAARILLLTLLGITAAVALTYQVLAISYRYPLDYGEAPLIDQALRLGAGENIYRADLSTPPYVIANYPPVYQAALVPFLRMFGPSFTAGRLVSAVCAWVAAAFLALIVIALTRDRLAGLVSGLLFITFPFVVGWSALARIDLLALALSLGALYLIARPQTAPLHVVGAAVLLCGAIYTRQSYALAAPMAVFVSLWLHDRRTALGFAVMLGTLTVGAFLILNALTRSGFYFNIVTANVNEFDVEWLLYNFDRFRAVGLVLLLIGAASVLIRQPVHPWPMVAAYLVGATLSAVTVGKVGSNINYFLELCAAVCLAAGTVLAWSRQHPARQMPVMRRLPAVMLIALTVQAAISMFAGLGLHREQLQPRRKAANELRQLETLVAQSPGPILADEYMGLLTLQGRPLLLQPFEMAQLAEAHQWDQSPLVNRIRNKEFSLILIHYSAQSPVHKVRWTRMLEAIEQSYSITHVLAGTAVYEPSALAVE